jgi:capsular polysaccharide biosynthesis protein
VELRRYLDVSRRWWWAVALAFLATTAVTVRSVSSEEPRYESTATFVVRPRPVDNAQEARAFDALIRGVTINTTYASIASSDLIRARAEEDLDPTVRNDDMDVDAKVLTDANIVSVKVNGPDPDHVLALADAISAETVEYVNGLSDVYLLQPLDEPKRADEPVETNRMLTISLGIVLGLALGVGLAMLVEYVREGSAAGRPGSSSATAWEATPSRDATLRLESQAREAIARNSRRDNRVGARASRGGPTDSPVVSDREPDNPS